tara:strand:- start:1041 stop:1589 length:549 start_codon:yes stop_codon:yes gene_type:complete
MILGLTGYMGVGKTTASKFFHDAIAINVDEVAHEILTKGSEPYKKVVRAFGKKILDEEEHISRVKLADLVFVNEDKLKKLEKITHPLISQIVNDIAENEKKKFIVIDCAILEKLSLDNICDKILLIEATEKTVSQRVEFTHEEIMKRRKSQKISKFDYTIKNNGSLEELKEHILSFQGTLFK